MAVVKEKEILKRLEVSGLSDAQKEVMVRETIEKMGVDFGRTVHCRGAHPNREWTNRSEEFEASPEEVAVKKSAEAESLHRTIRAEAENMLRDKELADLKAELAAMKAESAAMKVTPSTEGTLHLNKDIDRRSKEWRDSHPREEQKAA